MKIFLRHYNVILRHIPSEKLTLVHHHTVYSYITHLESGLSLKSYLRKKRPDECHTWKRNEIREQISFGMRKYPSECLLLQVIQPDNSKSDLRHTGRINATPFVSALGIESIQRTISLHWTDGVIITIWFHDSPRGLDIKKPSYDRCLHLGRVVFFNSGDSYYYCFNSTFQSSRSGRSEAGKGKCSWVEFNSSLGGLSWFSWLKGWRIWRDGLREGNWEGGK